MIIDARELRDESTLEADICIVGGGPAGLTVARELRGAGLQVCLVESGGSTPHPTTEALNDYEALESDFADGIETRSRALGGTSHRWNVFTGGLGWRVRYLPLAPQDFEAREWVPDSGWPFTRADLEPYYRRAHAIVGLPGYGHDPASSSSAKRPLLPLDPSRVETAVEWYGSPSVFRHWLPAILARDVDTTVLTHATATQICFDAGRDVASGVEVRTLSGRRHVVRAGRVVLASGGIENARLLLLSRARHPDGVGNEHGLVGRYYLDHLKLVPAEFVPADRSLFDRAGFYDIHANGRAALMGKLRLSREVQAAEGLLDVGVRLEPRLPDAPAGTGEAWARLLRGARRGHPSLRAGAAVLRSSRGLPALLALGGELAFRQGQPLPSLNAGWSRLARPSRHYDRFELELQMETAPHADQRITLGRRRDALGRPVPAITWRWGDLERRAWRRTLELLDQEFRRARLGEVRIARDAPGPLVARAGDNHPSGSTRMHVDPRCGVVDANCRVHSVENLYVAGSSTFPAGGYANPTLTIVALAARLADHLRAG